MPVFKPSRPGALYWSRSTGGLRPKGKARGLVLGSSVASAPVAPSLVSIAVTPANPSIAAGSTEQFTATGTYSDSSTANITGSVTWSSSNTGEATIASGGLATGVSAGSPNIIATDPTTSIAGQTTLTVTASMPIGPGFQPAIVLSTIGDSILAGNTFPQSQYACSRQICASLGQYWALGPILAIPGASLSTGSGSSQISLQWTTGVSGGQNSPSGELCCVAGMPNVWFMDGGGNDVIVFGRTQAQAGADFGTTAQTVTSYLSGISAGGSGIGHILVVMTPTGRTGGDLSTLASLIRTNYASWAASGVRVILADAALDPNIGQGADTGSSYYVDGVHLSSTGAALLASIVQAALTAAGVVSAVNAAAPARIVDGVNTLPGLSGRYRMHYSLVADAGTMLWIDIAGNSNHLIRPPIVQRPGYSTAIAGYNSRGVATLNGSQDMLYSVQWAVAYGADRNNGVQVLTLAPPYTLYVVGNITTSAANASMYGFSPSNYLWGDGGTPSKYNFVPAGGSGVTGISVGATPHIFCIAVTSTSATCYVDSSATPVSTVTAAQATQTDAVFGALTDSGGQNPSLTMTGNIGALIICEGFAHGPSDIHTVFSTEGAFFGQSWT